MIPCRGSSLANEEVHAIAWAAKRAGKTYGAFASCLTLNQRVEILEEFRAMKKAQKEEEEARLKLAAERKQNEKQMRKDDPYQKAFGQNRRFRDEHKLVDL